LIIYGAWVKVPLPAAAAAFLPFTLLLLNGWAFYATVWAKYAAVAGFGF